MKILVDMNLSTRWVPFLLSNGFEAMHWSSIGFASSPDTEITAYARENDFVILTHDLDFGAILAATGGEKPSVAQLRAGDLRIESIGPRVAGALRQSEQELEQGALITIDTDRTRLRILPFAGL